MERATPVADLLRLAAFIRRTRDADEEVQALFEQFDAEALSFDQLRAKLQELALRQ